MRHFATFSLLLLAPALPIVPVQAQQDVISTVIGGGPDGIAALESDLYQPKAIAVDASGNYYFSTYGQNRTFKVNPSGILTVVAGLGVSGYGGDGLPGGAGDALLDFPDGVAVDAAGNVYIADVYNCIVRKVDTSNTITTVAGQAKQCGFGGDGEAATRALLYHPSTLALSGGNLYIADQANCRIRKLVISTGIISTYVGTGTTVSCGFAGDGGAATSALLNQPTGVAVDTAGNLYISDTNNYRIREVIKSTGIISTIAGNGTPGYAGDGGLATGAEIRQVYEGIAVNGPGTSVTIADTGNNRVRQFALRGQINTIADSNGGGGFCGDDGPALSACFNSPQGLAVSGAGSVYVSDQNNNRIREFTVGGNISTVAGNGSNSTPTLSSKVPPQAAVLNYPYGMLVDPAGNIFVNDSSNCMVRELVKSTDLLNFFAGTGTCADSGDGGPATSATLNRNYGLARDSQGNLYIADTYNCIVRQVNSAGKISTFAGTPGRCGYLGDGGPATSAELSLPYGLAVDSKNNLYIADYNNSVVRKVSQGTIRTAAGNGTAGFLGDGDPATDAELNHPVSISLDGRGNLYIADQDNCVIRELMAPTGIIQTVAGVPRACSFNGDGPAVEHELAYPQGVLADAAGNLFIADTNNQRIRWVDPLGNMTTIAGDGTAGLSGDGGPATDAELYYPSAVAKDASGNYLIVDQYNFRVRGVSAFAAMEPSVSSLSFGLEVVESAGAPQVFTIDALGPLNIGSLSVTGAFSESDDCGTSLGNGTSCQVYVYFQPTSAGAQTGTLTILDNGFFNSATSIPLAGTGAAISLTGGPLLFGSQAVKSTSAAMKVTVTNNGAASVTMGTIGLDEMTDFALSANTCPAPGSPLAGKGTCTLSVVFTPQTTGVKKGALVINDSDPSSPQVVGMTGTGTSSVAFSPASVVFAAQAIRTTSASSKITLTNNTGATLKLGNPALSLSGPFASTHATTCTNGLPIAAKGTCSIFVVFTPTARGYATGSVSVADSDRSSPQMVALAGTGTGLLFTPASVNFGTANLGVQVSSTVTITNVSSAPITFTAGVITGTHSADFLTNNTDPPCQGLLAAGAVCTFTMYFRPSLVGTENASYLVYDNSPGSPQSLPLTGTGQ